MSGPFDFNSSFECTPSRSGNKKCLVFAWIGQSFASCDNCGKPYWEHLFDPVYGGGKGAYRIKVYHKYLGWRWKDVNPITPEHRERVKQKWMVY